MVRSFDPSAAGVVTTPSGARAHRLLVEHLDRLTRRFEQVRPGVWCLIGNGLSNQTFVEGPEGIIAIDTGESVQEMRAALRELRTVTDRPVVAVLYTHFHYVAGTTAVFEEAGGPVPVYGHVRIEANRRRVGDEIAPLYGRGIAEQFGTDLPAEGPDAQVHVGLGLGFRFAEHAPWTPGYVPPTITTDRPVRWTIAGLQVEVTPAPSDADDSITVWFPELATAVQNIVWPALFNVFAIRGEEYRDPRTLLVGIDHVRSLGAEHLVATHGPVLHGAASIAARVQRYRDSVQFLWDQTVRGMNKGWTTDEWASRVRLPELYDEDFLTSERYGVAEHHVRQIHNGLKGWFDGDPAELFPLPPAERAGRLIAGFGGPGVVRQAVHDAVAADDLRWAAELATWLVMAPSDDAGEGHSDRHRLAGVLRRIGQRSPAANIRNWALTRARDLEGTAPLDRFRTHRLRRDAVTVAPVRSVSTLRVLLDPDRAVGMDRHVRFDFGAGGVCGLHVRNAIACPTDGSGATIALVLAPAVWADIVTGRRSLADALSAGDATVTPTSAEAATVDLLACFELP